MSRHSHLNPGVSEGLSWPSGERIEFDRQADWVDYTRAQYVIQVLEDLPAYPLTLGMPYALLVGEQGDGKSTLLEHFRYRCPTQVQRIADRGLAGLHYRESLGGILRWFEGHIANRFTEAFINPLQFANSIAQGCSTRKPLMSIA